MFVFDFHFPFLIWLFRYDWKKKWEKKAHAYNLTRNQVAKANRENRIQVKSI